MSRALHITIGLLFILGITAVTAVADDNKKSEQKKLEVNSVNFKGNKVYSDDDLQSVMVTRPSGFLSHHYYRRNVFLNDLKSVVDYYHVNGYLQAAITDTSVVIDSAKSQVNITLTIHEGELTRVEGIRFFGNRFFADSTLRKQVKLKKGGPYLKNQVQNATISILSLYADSGFLNASINPKTNINSSALVADIDFNITEGHRCTIDSIAIEGLEKTHANVVTRELEFKKGQVVRYQRLLDSQRQLYMTGLFQSVFVHPKPDTSESTGKVILVELKERKSSEFNIAAGYGSVVKVKGRIQLMTDNLAGTGRKLGGELHANFIQRGATVSFSEPWTFGTRWQTDINLLYEYLLEPSYNLLSYGGALQVGRRIGKHTSISFILQIINGNISHVEVIDTLPSFKPKTRSITARYIYDTRDNLFNPLRGVYGEVSQEVNGGVLGGGNNFLRTDIVGKWFHKLSNRLVLASGIQIGVIEPFGSTPDIALSDRFYTGGPTSIRSLDYHKAGPLDPNGEPLGGRFLIVWHLAELRVYIWKWIGMAAFVDVGNVWSRVNDISMTHLPVAVGPGLRINSPVGTLRLDWGFNPDRQPGQPKSKLYFGMGQAF